MRAGMGVAQAFGAHVDAGTTPAFGNNAVKGRSWGAGWRWPRHRRRRRGTRHRRAGSANRPQARAGSRQSPVISGMVPWVRRSPTVTATMATEIEASNSRAAEDRKASFSVRIVARRWRWLTTDDVDLALGPAVGDQRRQAPHHVDEMAGERRQSRPAPVRVGLGWFWPMSAAKKGSSGSVSTTMRALSQSTQTSAVSASTGTTAAWTSAGRKRAAYGSTVAVPCAARVTAASGAGRSSAGRLSQRPRGPAVGHRHLTPARAARVRRPGQPGANDEECRRPRPGPTEVVCRRPPPPAPTGRRRGRSSRTLSTPTAARTAIGARAVGAAWSSRGSKGFIGHAGVPQWTATALGIWWVEIRFRKAQWGTRRVDERSA